MNRLFIGFILLTGLIWGQNIPDTLHCNGNILSEFSNGLDSLSYQTARKFLLTFDERCENNVEYSEWSNELLFKFVESNPLMLIEILTKEEGIKANYIIKVLEQPLDDGIDLKTIYNKVEKVDLNSEVKVNILKSIKIAIDNS